MGLNKNKAKQLLKNAVIPATGCGIVFFLAFGFGWWIAPAAILFGGVTSLVISKPKSLQLTEGKRQLSLKEASPEKMEDLYSEDPYFSDLFNNFNPRDDKRDIK